ncbi:DUF805 domain-containing protein [Litorisediminicola beolgyonensis]|uniref:DUF805 domain-containing protein n=1 Tax=Litorisediminicola beolgyonensis TaxID=1173614 RepID=A0ABW3ZEL1_9RHOB
MTSLTNAFQHGLSHYASFASRTDRATFWWYVLAVFLIIVITNVIDGLVFGWAPEAGEPISFLVALALILPNIAIGARRLHDTGRSGWWLLLCLIPVIGTLVLIWFYIQKGEPGPNAYGDAPR